MWLKYSIISALCALVAAQDGLGTVKNGTANAHWSMPGNAFPPPNPGPSPYGNSYLYGPGPGPGPLPGPIPYPGPMPFAGPGPFPGPVPFGGPGPFPGPPPFPGFPGPNVPPPPVPLPPIDPYVCTLDATVLLVLEPVRRHAAPPVISQPPITPPIGAARNKRDSTNNQAQQHDDPNVGITPPCLPGYPGAPRHCGNAVRVRCAETAVADILTCTGCCRLASKFYGFPKDAIQGVLIDAKLLRERPQGLTRKKREFLPPLEPPSCAALPAPCPALQCMCCGPRLPFPFYNPFGIPGGPLPGPIGPPPPAGAFGPLPPPGPYGPLLPPGAFGPLPPPGPPGPLPGPGPYGPFPPPMPLGPLPPPMPFGPAPFPYPGPYMPAPPLFGPAPYPVPPPPASAPFPSLFPNTGQANQANEQKLRNK